MAYSKQCTGRQYTETAWTFSKLPTPDDLRNDLRRCILPISSEKYLRTQAMIYRFTFIADALNLMFKNDELIDLAADDSHRNQMVWVYINRLLRVPVSEYDFNAFTELHSMRDFTDALNRCLQGASNGDEVWHIVTCHKCGRKTAYDHRAVVEFEQRNAHLPIHCEGCGGYGYTERMMMRTPKTIYSDLKPVNPVSAWA